jgi:NAD+-dependent secondary alcohol dehydrogenase Adh1
MPAGKADLDHRHIGLRGWWCVKAVRLREYGKCPQVEEVPKPVVAKPFDVLVEVGGAAVCGIDLDVIQGRWAARTDAVLPLTLGHENAGWVREVGPAVSTVRPGDAVLVHPLITCGLCRPCRSGDEAHCERAIVIGVDADGGMAEFLLTSARSLVTLRPRLQPADVATLADAGLTAFRTVRRALPLLYPGTCAVVLGSGRLSRIGMQCLLALSPAEVVVVDLSDRARETATELGAHHTVRAGREQVEAVRALTSGEGADVVLDFTEKPGEEAAGVAMLRRAGSYFVVGSGAGMDIPPVDVLASAINIIGNFSGSHADLADLMTLAAQHRITLETAAYDLDSVDEVLRDLARGRLRDWGVLIPGAG